MSSIGGGPARLAGRLSSAEAVLGEAGASRAALAWRELLVQPACLRVAAHPGWAGRVLGQVARAQRAAAAADVGAAADLVALTPPAARLARWRVVPAQSLAALSAGHLPGLRFRAVRGPGLGRAGPACTRKGPSAGASWW